MNIKGWIQFRGIILSFLIFFLLFSCSSRKVLVLTDPYWEDFSAFCGSSPLTRGIGYLKQGLLPVFKTFRGEDEDFPQWFEEVLESSHASSVTVSYPYLRFSRILEETFLPLTVLQLNGSAPYKPDYSYGISIRLTALENAGEKMREMFEQTGALPILIFYKNNAVFNNEFEAFLNGWGSGEAIPDSRILLLERSMNDINGHILRFFNSFDRERQSYTLLAVPDLFLPNLIDLWPDDPSISVILASPDYEFLPDNVKFLIYPDLQGLLNASARLSSGRAGEEILYVESELLQR